MHNVLKPRQGFTLAEVLVALTMTAVIGAAVTGVFISQSKFFDHQEKVGFARGVTRGATNMIMSELRMLEIDKGIVEATNTKIIARVPMGMAVICRVGGAGLTVSRLPSDASITDDNYYGYAYRRADGSYDYREPASKPTPGSVSNCTGANVRVVAGSTVHRLNYAATGQPPADTGAAVLLYQRVIYEFKASKAVPGRIGLFRQVEANPVISSTTTTAEELVAPFDTTAKFRFYVNDQPDAQDAVPGVLGDITGLELVLDGLSERPNSDGSHQSVPSTTSIFFKNRP